MRYKLKVLILLSIISVVGNESLRATTNFLDLFPKDGIVKFEGIVETYNISDLDGTPSEVPNISKVESYFSLSDERFILKLKPLEMSMKKDGVDKNCDKVAQNITIVFDGKTLKEYKYKTIYDKGASIIDENSVVIKTLKESTIFPLEDFFLGKSFFMNYIYFFKGRKNINLLEAINGNFDFPKLEKKLNNTDMEITATTEGGVYKAVISLEGVFPMPKSYSMTHYSYSDKAQRLDIIFSFSNSVIQILNTGIMVPKSFERRIFSSATKQGFKMVVTANAFELLSQKVFDPNSMPE